MHKQIAMVCALALAGLALGARPAGTAPPRVGLPEGLRDYFAWARANGV